MPAQRLGDFSAFSGVIRDTARNLCFNVVLDGPGQAPAGLITPPNYGLEWATMGPASSCPTRAPLAARTNQVTGTVAVASLASPRKTI